MICGPDEVAEDGWKWNFGVGPEVGRKLNSPEDVSGEKEKAGEEPRGNPAVEDSGAKEKAGLDESGWKLKAGVDAASGWKDNAGVEVSGAKEKSGDDESGWNENAGDDPGDADVDEAAGKPEEEEAGSKENAGVEDAGFEVPGIEESVGVGDAGANENAGVNVAGAKGNALEDPLPSLDNGKSLDCFGSKENAGVKDADLVAGTLLGLGESVGLGCGVDNNTAGELNGPPENDWLETGSGLIAGALDVTAGILVDFGIGEELITGRVELWAVPAELVEGVPSADAVIDTPELVAGANEKLVSDALWPGVKELGTTSELEDTGAVDELPVELAMLAGTTATVEDDRWKLITFDVLTESDVAGNPRLLIDDVAKAGADNDELSVAEAVVEASTLSEDEAAVLPVSKDPEKLGDTVPESAGSAVPDSIASVLVGEKWATNAELEADGAVASVTNSDDSVFELLASAV
ncbi:hypothetical protein K470DRAFT_271615 [Piedraia hortae CBS 480.64]|uniref:Uncharacterized protein n=1 Tax=Piedraia hortae CBS 480.64 TaxID=1314780 RepID=A0A6A7BW58_9PEZI|nr:hypothetical protein K470DRAFT_271615 [Piedraia hortae CBS 480.64]